jgi:predicted enzyme related to lactoylglutathione lyase
MGNGFVTPGDFSWTELMTRDVDAMAKKAKEAGATIIVPPTDIPNVGRFCRFQDPEGAVLSVITYLKKEM